MTRTMLRRMALSALLFSMAGGVWWYGTSILLPAPVPEATVLVVNAPPTPVSVLRPVATRAPNPVVVKPPVVVATPTPVPEVIMPVATSTPGPQVTPVPPVSVLRPVATRAPDPVVVKPPVVVATPTPVPEVIMPVATSTPGPQVTPVPKPEPARVSESGSDIIESALPSVQWVDAIEYTDGGIPEHLLRDGLMFYCPPSVVEKQYAVSFAREINKGRSFMATRDCHKSGPFIFSDGALTMSFYTQPDHYIYSYAVYLNCEGDGCTEDHLLFDEKAASHNYRVGRHYSTVNINFEREFIYRKSGEVGAPLRKGTNNLFIKIGGMCYNTDSILEQFANPDRQLECEPIESDEFWYVENSWEFQLRAE